MLCLDEISGGINEICDGTVTLRLQRLPNTQGSIAICQHILTYLPFKAIIRVEIVMNFVLITSRMNFFWYFRQSGLKPTVYI